MAHLMAHIAIYCNLSYFGGCGVLQFINLMLTDGYYMYFHCVGGGFGGKGTASVRLAVSASVAAFKSVLPHPTQKLRSHFCSLLMKFDLNVCLSLLAFSAAPAPAGRRQGGLPPGEILPPLLRIHHDWQHCQNKLIDCRLLYGASTANVNGIGACCTIRVLTRCSMFTSDEPSPRDNW